MCLHGAPASRAAKRADIAFGEARFVAFGEASGDAPTCARE